MRKHLSVLGLAARGAVGRILLITVLTAVLAGALLYLVPFVLLFLGYAIGCGYGTKTDLTMRRLRIGEGAANLWWMALNAVCLLFYWAVMAAVTVLVLQLRIRNIVPDNALYTPGRQTLLLAVYASSFLHHLMPVRDTLVWAEDGLLLALCAAAAARFSQAQRRGKFSIAPIAALALTIGGFFPRMGAASTFIWAFVAAAGAGLCVVLLQKGETEDAEKQDFRVRQDA